MLSTNTKPYLLVLVDFCTIELIILQYHPHQLFAAVQQANPCYHHALQYPSTLSVQHIMFFFLWAAALAGTTYCDRGPLAAFALVCPVGVSVPHEYLGQDLSRCGPLRRGGRLCEPKQVRQQGVNAELVYNIFWVHMAFIVNMLVLKHARYVGGNP